VRAASGTRWGTVGARCAVLAVAVAGARGAPAAAGAAMVSEFAVPTAGSAPFAIAAGPDGALWFTERSGNKIGRITTAGTITEFPLPDPGSRPRGIAAGPDGALWFTEQDANKIGRITTGGTISEFAIPTAGSGPLGIAAGSDGALWFTESNVAKVGRITTGGTISEFAVPTAGSLPFEIAAGGDHDRRSRAGPRRPQPPGLEPQAEGQARCTRALPADRDRRRRGPARLQQRHGPPALKKGGARKNDRREVPVPVPAFAGRRLSAVLAWRWALAVLLGQEPALV